MIESSVAEPFLQAGGPEVGEEEYYSDLGYYPATVARSSRKIAKKRADIKAKARSKLPGERIAPQGEVWAACVADEIQLEQIQKSARRRVLSYGRLEIHIEQFFSDVFLGYLEVPATGSVIVRTDQVGSRDPPEEQRRRYSIYIFKFGCIVIWDLPLVTGGLVRNDLICLLQSYFKNELSDRDRECDSMNYVNAIEGGDAPPHIKQDIIHLKSNESFEKLAYSYGFAQSCKLSVFENNVHNVIENTRAIPEHLAKTGKVHTSQDQISKMIGLLFINRFYINLQCDILDTPDVFWDFDQYVDYYVLCRNYLEIPKRAELLNQRLDIMKDLYDMLNEELSLQHGYKLEWIVIYLIVVEVLIEVVWNIIIKDLLKWV